MRSPHRLGWSAAAIVLAASVSGCAAKSATKSFDALMDSWEGHTLDNLVGTWGAPAYLYADGAGGEVAVYVPAAAAPERRRAPVISSSLGSDDEVPRAPLTEYRSSMAAGWPVHRIFFVDGGGRIYRSQWRGDWVCCSQ